MSHVNVQANNGSITGPIIDRTGYSWITTEPAGIVYNSPSDYLLANDSTIPRTNVANTFSQPQAISVPGGNATLTLNGCTVRANNSNEIVYATPENGQGMYFRPNGDTNSAKQVVFDASNFSVTGLNANFSNAVTMSSTLRVNGAASLLGGVNVNGSVNSNGVVSKMVILKQIAETSNFTMHRRLSTFTLTNRTRISRRGLSTTRWIS